VPTVLETRTWRAQNTKPARAFQRITGPRNGRDSREELRMSGEAGSKVSGAEQEQAIRERVRSLMGQLLQQGRMDPEGVKEVMRAVTGGVPPGTTSKHDTAGMEFAEDVRRLHATLVGSSEAAHHALQTVAMRGEDSTDNDIKGALASLLKLQQDCLAAVNRISERASGENLRRELDQLAVHAQNVGVEASARAGALMNEFTSRIAGTYRETAAPSLEAARAFSARMALLASGVIAGVADALSDQSGPKNSK
jgi:hypothetical protein